MFISKTVCTCLKACQTSILLDSKYARFYFYFVKFPVKLLICVWERSWGTHFIKSLFIFQIWARDLKYNGMLLELETWFLLHILFCILKICLHWACSFFLSNLWDTNQTPHALYTQSNWISLYLRQISACDPQTHWKKLKLLLRNSQDTFDTQAYCQVLIHSVLSLVTNDVMR